MKEYLERYKEFSENRRRMGTIKLSFWVIFFGILLLIYYFPSNSNKKHIPPKTENKEEQQEDIKITNYSFNYTLNEEIYSGYYYEGNIELIGEKYSFYITDNKILSNQEDAIMPDYTYLDINKVNDLIENSELEATTSYKDGKEEYKYINTSDNEKIIINYMSNNDDTINVHLEYNDNDIDIYYYNINKTNITFEENKYIYELKEVEHEY